MSRPWETWGTREVPDYEREILGHWANHMTPAPPDPVTWADIKGIAETLPEPSPARALHCGRAVWDMLRDLKPADTDPLGLGAALGGQPLYGVPVHVDLTMPTGRWEMREGDRVAASGDVTPEPGAFYVPGLGWVAFRPPKDWDDYPPPSETYPGSGIYE